MAPRQKPYTYNKPEQIKLSEEGFRFRMRHVIKNKWIYVLHRPGSGKGGLRLIDEIYITKQKQWKRFKPGCVGKQKRWQTAGNLIPNVSNEGYTVRTADLFNGTFYFYLSPIQFHEETIKVLKELIDKEEAQRSKLEEEFKRCRELVGQKLGHGGTVKHNAIVWGRDATSSLLGKHKVASRAAFNFDENGKQVKSGFGLKAVPKWRYEVVLQDPETWLQDLHRYGAFTAIRLYKEYTSDPTRMQKRFIAASIDGILRKGDEKSIKKELMPIDEGVPSFADRPGKIPMRARRLMSRLGWKVQRGGKGIFILKRHWPSGVQHKIEVGQDDWIAACYTSASRDAGSLYLNLDDLWCAGYVNNVSGWVRRMARYIKSPRHRVLQAEHVHATQKAAKAKATPAKPGMAARNAIRGAVHWSLVLSHLRECREGRKLLGEIRKAGLQQLPNTHPLYNALPRALTYKSVAPFLKDYAAFTAQQAVKATTSFLDIFMAGIDDPSFTLKTPSKVARFIDWWNKGVLDPTQSKLAQLDASKLHRQANFRVAEKEWDKIFNELDGKTTSSAKATKYPKYESALIHARAKQYSGHFLPCQRVTYVLGLVDLLGKLDNSVGKLATGKKLDLSDAGTLVTLLEQTHRAIEAVARVRHGRRGRRVAGKLRWSSRVALGKTKVFSTTGSALGCVGAFIDLAVSVDKIGKTRNPVAKGGYVVQAVGAGTALAASFYALAAGASLGGPFGIAMVGAQLTLALVSQYVIDSYENKHWKDACARCFLGKSGKVGKAAVARQYREWVGLMYSFDVALHPDKIVIKPGLLDRGDKMELKLTMKKESRGGGKSETSNTLNLVVRAPGKVVVPRTRGVAGPQKSATVLKPKMKKQKQDWEQITVALNKGGTFDTGASGAKSLDLSAKVYCYSKQKIRGLTAQVPKGKMCLNLSIDKPFYGRSYSRSGAAIVPPERVAKGTADIYTTAEVIKGTLR